MQSSPGCWWQWLGMEGDGVVVAGSGAGRSRGLAEVLPGRFTTAGWGLASPGTDKLADSPCRLRRLLRAVLTVAHCRTPGLRKDLHGYFFCSIPKSKAIFQVQLPSLHPCGLASLPAGWGLWPWCCPCWLWLSCARPLPRCVWEPSTSRRSETPRCPMRKWRASSSV